jgi:hypothetical protein
LRQSEKDCQWRFLIHDSLGPLVCEPRPGLISVARDERAQGWLRERSPGDEPGHCVSEHHVASVNRPVAASPILQAARPDRRTRPLPRRTCLLAQTPRRTARRLEANMRTTRAGTAGPASAELQPMARAPSIILATAERLECGRLSEVAGVLIVCLTPNEAIRPVRATHQSYFVLGQQSRFRSFFLRQISLRDSLPCKGADMALHRRKGHAMQT